MNLLNTRRAAAASSLPRYCLDAAAVVSFSLFVIGEAAAGDVEITAARAYASGGDQYRFEVTLRHADTGWDHYADEWQVLTPAGEVLGTRVLYHPHVDEQPFTRSLSGVKIAPEHDAVVIRAHDSVHGYNSQTLRVELPDR